MAPRFVEVARPVEAGVEWASSLPSAFGERVNGLIPDNTTSILATRIEYFFNSLPEIKALGDLQSMLSRIAQIFPTPRIEVKYLAMISLVALILRTTFVFVYSRSIVSNYGAAKAIAKED